jgi:uncharacterized protein YjbJ (UPF0337 family)
MGGTSDKIKGSIKETAGKMTGDKHTEAEGKADKVKGDVKNIAEDVKESVKDTADHH